MKSYKVEWGKEVTLALFLKWYLTQFGMMAYGLTYGNLG